MSTPSCDLVEAIRDHGGFAGVHIIGVSRYRELAARLGGRLAGRRTARVAGPTVPIASGACCASCCRRARWRRATLDLFEAADLTVVRSSSVDYKATIDDPRVAEVRILRPQEIPVYVAEGLFDVGITGRDWIEETSQRGRQPRRAALLEGDEQPDPDGRRRRRRLARSPSRRSCADGVRVSSEYPELTRRYFAKLGIDADVRLSYGASEAKVPDIADCVVEITETGRALRAAGLRIIDTILVSYTEVIANAAAYEDPDKRHAMGQLMTLLNGTLEARDKVLIKLNVAEDALRGRARRAAVGEVADRVQAGRRRLRRREPAREAGDQPGDPGAQGRRGHRPARDPDRQDRPLTWPTGRVIDFDEHGRARPRRGRRRHRAPVPLRRDRRRHAHDRRSATDVEFDLLRKFGRDEARAAAPADAVSDMQERFVAVIVALGEGEVVSYGDVAEDAGFPGRSRAVGALLSNSPIDLPWWRVVRSDGRLATPPTAGQAALLRAEGVIAARRPGRRVPAGRFRR